MTHSHAHATPRDIGLAMKLVPALGGAARRTILRRHEVTHRRAAIRQATKLLQLLHSLGGGSLQGRTDRRKAGWK